ARERPATGITGHGARLRSALRSSRLQYLLVLLAFGGTVTLVLTFVSSGLRAAALSAGLRPESTLDIPAWAAAMIGVNLEHYWLDSRIWRTRRHAVMPAMAGGA